MSFVSALLSCLRSAPLGSWRLRTGAHRVLPLIFAFATLFGFSRSADAAVPMCSSDGRSIAAPPIMVPGRNLVLEAPRPCPPPPGSLLVRALPNDPGGQPTVPLESPLRVVPVFASAPPRPHAGRTLIEYTARPAGSPATDGIYRPPRA
jgi:hypothetical protein